MQLADSKIFSRSQLEKADLLIKENKVRITRKIFDNENSGKIKCKVLDSFNFVSRVELTVKDGRIEKMNCDCPDVFKDGSTCEHSAAAALLFDREFGDGLPEGPVPAVNKAPEKKCLPGRSLTRMPEMNLPLTAEMTLTRTAMRNLTRMSEKSRSLFQTRILTPMTPAR